MSSARTDHAEVNEYNGKLGTLVVTGYANNGTFFWMLAISCSDDALAAEVHNSLKNSSAWTNHAEPQTKPVLLQAVALNRIQADRLYRDAVSAIKA
jgi:hypothetical protein